MTIASDEFSQPQERGRRRTWERGVETGGSTSDLRGASNRAVHQKQQPASYKPQAVKFFKTTVGVPFDPANRLNQQTIWDHYVSDSAGETKAFRAQGSLTQGVIKDFILENLKNGNLKSARTMLLALDTGRDADFFKYVFKATEPPKIREINQTFESRSKEFQVLGKEQKNATKRWLILDGDKIVASVDTFREAADEANRYSEKATNPLIVRNEFVE